MTRTDLRQRYGGQMRTKGEDLECGVCGYSADEYTTEGHLFTAEEAAASAAMDLADYMSGAMVVYGPVVQEMTEGYRRARVHMDEVEREKDWPSYAVGKTWGWDRWCDTVAGKVMI